MTIRTFLPAVLLFALTAALTVGCSGNQAPATDPESLRQAAEEIKRMSQKENANKKENEKKGQSSE